MKAEDMDTAELVRQGYEALSNHDWEALGQLLVTDMRLERAPGLGSVAGAESVLGFARPDAFEWQRFEPQPGVIERGDKLLVPLVVRARGRDSEIEVVQDFFHVITRRAGRIARVAVHTDRAAALADLERP
ncbi:MAG TPA: nuclear transport factor 2 family protein [Thermoleophilaceae bacterium]|nr:nuclear transport factor 2 family protein [Thermoleophilaceae bacterium]